MHYVQHQDNRRRQSWIEGDAVQQLKKTAELPGMVRAVGMPDLHPGRGVPIGAVFISQARFYPYLVGNDIGCGMGLWRTGIERRKAKPGKMVDRFDGLERSWEGDTCACLAQFGIDDAEPDYALGTIGGGNHFAELQSVERAEWIGGISRLSGLETRSEFLALFLI